MLRTLTGSKDSLVPPVPVVRPPRDDVKTTPAGHATAHALLNERGGQNVAVPQQVGMQQTENNQPGHAPIMNTGDRLPA